MPQGGELGRSRRLLEPEHRFLHLDGASSGFPQHAPRHPHNLALGYLLGNQVASQHQCQDDDD